MKQILVFGAGLVARPLVHYLLNQPDFAVTVADIVKEKAVALTAGHPNGTAMQLGVDDTDLLSKTIRESDIVVSLLPWIYHLKVAKICLESNVNLVTASYVKPEMRALDDEVKQRKLIFLNEIGVDPGIDHMAAMKVIQSVQNHGGKIKSFYSYCGGLPSMEHNTNPLGYKFSWSPVGVMLATNSAGKYLRDGKIIEIPAEKLFEHYWFIDIPNTGTFEAYVNRDAIPYLELYNIPDAESMYRGTLRNIGHCETWNNFKKIGLLNQDRRYDFSKVPPASVIAHLANSNGKHLERDVATFLHIPQHSVTMHKMKWLGLFSNELLPLNEGSVFDMFAYILQNKLIFTTGEVDLLIQHHEFIAEYPDDRTEKITATLVDKGISYGDSSMSRTVSLPAAIATKLILNGEIKVTGVHIPVLPEIYEPVLAELEELNIKLVHQRHRL
ncbi:saccharopine dehydrogenase NADP-binding domain-containing protein [candidate division KSB1 bacterium]|nr:saccharopine dehydrogenase NADP-binding domain-containing protein [candidate division KSB1 bacterium]